MGDFKHDAFEEKRGCRQCGGYSSFGVTNDQLGISMAKHYKMKNI